MVTSDVRPGRNALLQFAAVSFISILSCSCSIIAGTEEAGRANAEQEQQVRLEYVETLRNQASLQGRSFQQTDYSADPAKSLQRPSSVFSDGFRVYATDAYTSVTVSAPRIFIFDRGLQAATIMPTAASAFDGRLLSPTAIAVGADGVVYVADGPQGKVFGYDRSGILLMVLGKTGEIAYPSALAIDGRRSRLFVADLRGRRVRVYTTLGNPLFDIGDLRSPSGVALDRDGAVYVLDSGSRKVHVYDPDGKPLRTFPVSSGVPGGPWQPKAIAVDSAGHLYAADSVHNKILLFDRDGRFLSTWGKTGSYLGDFWSPVSLFIDASDRVYIADQTNSRIQVYQFVK